MVMSSKSSITTVFFDLGLTLINFEGDLFRAMDESYLALARSLISSGCKFDALTFASHFEHVIAEYYRNREIDLIERPVEDYVARVLTDFGQLNVPENSIQSALTAMYRVTESYWVVEEDAHPVLERLKTDGYRLGAITNAANADDSHRLIDKFNLRQYFEVILISAEEGIRKPDAEIFNRALDRLSVSPSHAAMVGDTLSADIRGAQFVGMKGIWIKRRADRQENVELFPAIKPDAVIDELGQLPLILASMQS